MARKVFFSFHYERDAWRAAQVRNCNVLANEDEFGFIDSVDWEKLQREGDEAIESWINGQLKGTSVSVVLIGAETASRPWVRYEIVRSWNRGNGIVGVWIHNLKDKDTTIDPPGHNPFEHFQLVDGTPLSKICKVYDWAGEDGRNNLGKWVEEAVKIRAKYAENDKIDEVEKQSASLAAKAFTIPRVTSSAGFAPKAPWCPTYVDRKR
jgi:hypothetical protein